MTPKLHSRPSPFHAPCLGHEPKVKIMTRCTFNFLLDWVVFHGKHLQFNVKNGYILKTLCNMWKHHTTHPFICEFYAFESLIFYSRCDCEGNVIIIPSTMGTHQGDPLGGHYLL